MVHAPAQPTTAETMTARIKALRDASLQAKPSISAERARLLTEFRRKVEAEHASIPVRQAMGFQHILQRKALYLGEGELIIGERGPVPAAVTTYPELCAHSLQDLEILDSREKIPYSVNAATKAAYAMEIIPYWAGKTQRERLLSQMTPEWLAAYEAGIFTEFQEQRSPGHTVLGARMFRKGFLELENEIAQAIESLDFFGDPAAYDKREELRAMAIACGAIGEYARRYAELLESQAAAEPDACRKAELQTMAANCRRVPAHAPRTFWEALQHYWFIHLGVIIEMNPWDSFNPGRLDQHLYPFYKADIEVGRLTPEFARELLQAFWIKFHNHPAPPKVGVTAAESGTYTDFCLINLGGVKTDGSDAVNELTYVILDVIQEMRLLQPSSMVQLSKKNPDRFIKRALKIVATGFGQPSIFNTDAIVQELMRQGKTVEDARDGGASGCVEAGAFGREAYILSGYFNIPKVLELTLHNGVDPRSGRQLGLQTGDPATFMTYEEFYAAFEKQIRHFVDIKIRGNNVIDRLYATYLPAPFLSTLIDDCIKNGRDYHAGGARYNTTYIQGVGLGTITDCLASIKFNVFEDQRLTLPQMIEALDANFAGHDDVLELVREETPKFGNDDDRADNIMRQAFETYYQCINGRPNSRGGTHRVNMLPTTCHVYFGSVIGALPDGRKSGIPLSEGISPVQGADRHGPTAVLKSASKLDHVRTGGTLLNQKFTPEFMDDDAGIAQVAQLVRGYFRMDGHHIQFNVIDVETLRKAQEHPEDYRDLIVRVAGYSDYFVNLGRALQDEIINRTEHLGA